MQNIKKIFLALTMLALLGTRAQTAQPNDFSTIRSVPEPTSVIKTAMETAVNQTTDPLSIPVVYLTSAAAPTTPQRPSLLWPAVSFGYGFRNFFVSGFSQHDFRRTDSSRRQ
jgi:hypothetical protein